MIVVRRIEKVIRGKPTIKVINIQEELRAAFEEYKNGTSLKHLPN